MSKSQPAAATINRRVGVVERALGAFAVAGTSSLGYPAIQMAVDPSRVAELLKTIRPTQEKVVRLYFGLAVENLILLPRVW